LRHCPSLWLSQPLSLVLALACRGPGPDQQASAGLGSDPDGCRSFATLGGVDVGEQAGALRCRFDAESAEHRCEVLVDGEFASSVTEYASLADFVEAGHTLGKQTSLAETRVEKGQTRRLSYRYDELGRLVRSLDEAPGLRRVTVFADHDEQGRPRSATAESGDEDDCGGWLVRIEYADALGTVSQRSRPRDPERCGFAGRTLVERYDGVGNRVGAVAADAAGIGDSFVARHPTAIARVCL
jgi:YD repeat-containing protein